MFKTIKFELYFREYVVYVGSNVSEGVAGPAATCTPVHAAGVDGHPVRRAARSEPLQPRFDAAHGQLPRAV